MPKKIQYSIGLKQLENGEYDYYDDVRKEIEEWRKK